MNYNPTISNEYGVAEGKISANVGRVKDEKVFEEFNIRAYGKKSEFISNLPDGTYVVITGRLREDIRVNARNPNTTREKIYINIDSLRTMSSMEEDND